MFQKSVVHGLSYTDNFVNIPKAYVLAAVAIIAAIWVFVSLMRGKIEAIIKPIGLYIGVAVLSLVASALVQNFLDRKSTRLNSSHVAISYSVFCLKKKK